MIDWRRLPGGEEYYTARVTAEHELHDALRSMWRTVCELALPVHEASEWAMLKVEMWPDSGRIIAFPAIDSLNRKDRGGCELMVEPLFEFWEKLAESDESDESFESKLGERLTDLSLKVLAAFEDVYKRQECQHLRERRRHVVVGCYNAESTVAIVQKAFDT